MFNKSLGIHTVPYDGIVTVTISNGNYSITNTSVIVDYGYFNAVIVDAGKLGAGIYNITISSNAQSVNDNYTVCNVTFKNNLWYE